MPEEDHRIGPGTRVRLRDNPARTGTISQHGCRYIGDVLHAQVVFDDGSRTWIRAEALESLPETPDPIDDLRRGRLHGPSSLRRCLAHEKLSGRLANILYSMETSQTRFLAYQFKPVLKLIESPTNSLLIADEVGLGKTIEAGLIWTELRARLGARRLLVVCPPHLREKWQLELVRRFGVRATIWKAAELSTNLRMVREDPGHSFAAICSYQSLRPPRDWERATGLLSPRVRLAHDLLSAAVGDPVVDLLVMDEAHYMRNRGIATAQVGELLTQVAVHRVFLSATPIQTRTENLFNLVRLLDPDTFTDPITFENIIRANAPLVRLRDLLLDPRASAAQIEQRLAEAVSNSYLASSQVLRGLQRDLTADPGYLRDNAKRSELAYRAERANLLGHAVTRTRKRDVLEDRVIRQVRALRFELSPQEKSFYDGVTELVHGYAAQRDLPTGFLRVMPQRQVSSSMAAACARWWNEDEKPDALDDEDVEEDDEAEAQDDAHPLVTCLRRGVRTLATPQVLEQGDSKYGLLLKTLREYWSENPGEKVVLFSYFRPTLGYLKRRLAGDGILASLLVGGMPESKQSVVESFRTTPGIRLLLSSEVGGEGLDLQFARVLINYDLPWNPMVVEQRIGRLDRIGQTADTILIFSFLARDTVDEDIYVRLYERLDLFRISLGDLEDVLGQAIAALTRDLLSHRLTAEQRQSRIDQTQLAIANEKAQADQLEAEASLLAAYGDYIIRQVRASYDLQSWVKAGEIERYVLDFFRNRYPRTHFQGLDATEKRYEIDMDPDAAYEFEGFLRAQNLTGQTTLPNPPRVRLRFENRSYVPSAHGEEVVTQAHPLVRFASWTLRVERLVAAIPAAVKLDVPAEGGILPGRYAFNVQRWEVAGLRAFERLQYSAFDLTRDVRVDDPLVAERLIELAAYAGMDWKPTDEELDLGDVAMKIEHLDSRAATAFLAFQQQCVDENHDRARVQTTSVDRYEQRRSETLRVVAARHQAEGRRGLAEAVRGQLERLRDRCDRQRREIRDRAKTTAGFSQVCVGVVEVTVVDRSPGCCSD